MTTPTTHAPAPSATPDARYYSDIHDAITRGDALTDVADLWLSTARHLSEIVADAGELAPSADELRAVAGVVPVCLGIARAARDAADRAARAPAAPVPPPGALPVGTRVRARVPDHTGWLGTGTVVEVDGDTYIIAPDTTDYSAVELEIISA